MVIKPTTFIYNVMEPHTSSDGVLSPPRPVKLGLGRLLALDLLNFRLRQKLRASLLFNFLHYASNINNIPVPLTESCD